jgi:hypothetical protein
MEQKVNKYKFAFFCLRSGIIIIPVGSQHLSIYREGDNLAQTRNFPSYRKGNKINPLVIANSLADY